MLFLNIIILSSFYEKNVTTEAYFYQKIKIHRRGVVQKAGGLSEETIALLMSTAGLSFSGCMISHQPWGAADAQCIGRLLLSASVALTAHLAALVGICYDAD